MNVIDAPGVYDLDAATYHADPCPVPSLNSSIAKLLIAQTPMHAAYEHPRLNPDFKNDNDYKFDFGNAMHAALLGGARIAIIQAENYKTKVAQEQRDAALSRQSIPILAHQYERVMSACRAIWRELAQHEAKAALDAGKPEQTLIWREGETWCRAKLDWLPACGADFYDLKTTTDANPEAFERQIFNLGYDIQCAFYRRGIRTVLGIAQPRFRFVPVETHAPHGVSVCQLSPSALDLAERKIEEALVIWAACVKSGKWPGYPPFVAHIDAPAWHQARYEERQIRREVTDRFADQTILGAG